MIQENLEDNLKITIFFLGQKRKEEKRSYISPVEKSWLIGKICVSRKSSMKFFNSPKNTLANLATFSHSLCAFQIFVFHVYGAWLSLSCDDVYLGTGPRKAKEDMSAHLQTTADNDEECLRFSIEGCVSIGTLLRYIIFNTFGVKL